MLLNDAIPGYRNAKFTFFICDFSIFEDIGFAFDKFGLRDIFNRRGFLVEHADNFIPNLINKD